jgi:dolichol-phosphate mannosyltransferase
VTAPLGGSSATATPDLGIVVPAHNEEVNLPVLAAELESVLGPAGVRFELLLVDDGSRDRTRDVIRELAASRASVRGLLLSRNFGHQAAISTGLAHVRGRAVAIMDADLQDRPEDLLALYRMWQSERADVVYAVRRTRKEMFLKRAAYRTFYRLLGRMARIPIPLDSGDFCVMNGDFVRRLNALPERVRFVRGLRAWLGGRQIPLAVDRDPRRAGEPQYTMGKLMRLASDGVFSFSDIPLRLASVMGFVVAGLAFLGAILVLAWKAMGLLPTGGGVATIALAVFFLGGIQLVSIGVLGEYIGRIFDEVKGRPVGVVAEIVEGAAND